MKVVIYGEEFNFDFLDADEMERAEAAIKKVQDRNTIEAYSGMSQSQVIRKQCGAVFDFFDEVFGEGTHERIFKGKCNLMQALGAFEAFINAKEESVNEVRALKDKYSPNRAQRRAPQNPAAHGQYSGNRKKKGKHN